MTQQRTLLALFGLILFTAGCGESTEPSRTAQEKLIGSWNGTLNVTDDKPDGTISFEQISALKAMKMDIVFNEDGTMQLSGVTAGQPYESTGRWQVVRENGDEVTFKSIESEGKEKDIGVSFRGEDSFVMPLPGPAARVGAMKFRRVQ